MPGTAAQRRQAQNEAFVRFNPEGSALREMLRQAIHDRDSAIHAAVSSHKTLSAAIDHAIPEVKGAVGTAQTAFAGSQAMIDQALAGVHGSGADLLKTGVTVDRAHTGSKLADELARALKDYSNRRIEAAAGEVSARRQAQAQYGSTVDQVQHRSLDLAAEEGAFTQGRVGELQKEAADRSFKKELAQLNNEAADKRSRRSARTQQSIHNDAASMKRAEFIAKYGITPEQAAKGVKPKHNRTASDLAKIRAQTEKYNAAIDEARGHVQKMKDGGLTRAQIIQNLRTGGSRPVVDPKTGKKVDSYKWPHFSIPVVKAALEAESQGYYSQSTVHSLRMLGVHVDPNLLPPKRGTPRGLANDVLRGTRKIASTLGRVGK